MTEVEDNTKKFKPISKDEKVERVTRNLFQEITENPTSSSFDTSLKNEKITSGRLCYSCTKYATKECVALKCDSCVRVYHLKCIKKKICINQILIILPVCRALKNACNLYVFL